MRPVGSWVLQYNNVVAAGLAVSLDKPLEWAISFFFGNTELSLELWTVIAGISSVRWVAAEILDLEDTCHANVAESINTCGSRQRDH